MLPNKVRPYLQSAPGIALDEEPQVHLAAVLRV